MSEGRSLSTTIVRRLTARQSSAIAVIAIEGPRAVALVTDAIRSPAGQPISIEEGRARFAHWHFCDAELSDEQVIVLVRNQQSVELHCHGGIAVVDQIIEQLKTAGADAEDGQLDRRPLIEFSDQPDAILQDEIRSRAEWALSRATTFKTAMILLEQSQGKLGDDLCLLRSLVRSRQSDQAKSLCKALCERGQFGTRLLTGWRLTLAGPPNAGKSSLTNCLCGLPRVIVHHEPGTTRDAVETNLVIGGWPLTLTDTAGIRQSHETIERQGIETAWNRWHSADIGLLVVDAMVGWTSEHVRLLAGPTKIFIVINKVDTLTSPTQLDQLVTRIQSEVGAGGEVLTSSAVNANGTDAIVRAITEYLDRSCPPPGSSVPFDVDQIDLVRRLAEA